MRRREFITLLGGAAATWPLSTNAQQAESKYTVGILSAGSNVAELTTVVAALRELGWVEGKNVVFEPRFAENRLERLPELATDLVRLKVDVIAAAGTLAPLAARQATSTIPIVISIGERARCQSGATRRQRHGDEPHGAGLGREAARIA
jgi:putative ABC transport system substrate-binding protein